MTEELVTDVVVVGSGSSGSGAALAAVRNGASVVLLEKLAEGGGSAKYSAGSFWTWEDRSRYAELAPGGNRELQYKMHGDHHVAADFIRREGVTIADTPQPSGSRYGISYKVDILQLLAHARETVAATGGQVLMETALIGLLEDGGRVTGVVARRADGSTVRIRAGAVVLATGGFQGDREMLARYVGPNSGELLVRSNPGSVGDGLRLATSKGAATTAGLATFYGHLIASPTPRFTPDDFRPLTQYYSEASLLVGRHGRRLADEVRGDSVLSNFVVQAPEARGVLIFDEHVRTHNATDEPFPGVGKVDRFARAVESGARHVTATTLGALIDEIATWGIDAATLRRTVDGYVEAVRSGAPTDPDGVPLRTGLAREPQTAPFHALEVRPAITFTFGGISTSADGEVLDRDGRPVPGLYAGGADIGGISHTAYAGGLAPCFITGMWAGASAARLAVPAAAVSS